MLSVRCHQGLVHHQLGCSRLATTGSEVSVCLSQIVKSVLYSIAARLLLQGYVDAAKSFQQESGTPPGVDLDAITDRMHIRKAVQGGDIEEAVDLVNDFNPEVGPAR